MSYKCRICRKPCPARQKLLRHVVYRPDKSILGEVPVCVTCHADLSTGTTVPQLIARLYPQAKAVVASPSPLKLF